MTRNCLFRVWELRAVILISQKVFIKLFCTSQLPHEFVNLFVTITNTENKLTNLCGN